MTTTLHDTTGTYLGDSNGKFVDIETTINNNNVTIEGAYSNLGTIYSLSGTFAMPSPSASITYVSIQVDNTGTLQMYSSLVSSLGLQAGNLIEVYAMSIPAGAVNDETFTSDLEPVMDDYIMD